MSHELRTPLNAILGFAQMLELGADKMVADKLREYIAIILKSGQHLLDLVNQILELSMVENQQVELRFLALSPAEIARHCMDMVREEAKRREVGIIDHTRALGPDVRFRGDPVRVRQVLLNLLSNAVKYNRPGGQVTLSCARNGDGMIRFAVADTGLGIPPERHGEVFQPFQRLGREAGQIEGSGIGLALARQLIQRLGGKIGFASAPGRGSTFWFDLPEVGNEGRE
jgi:signal transduction histidine kinase